MYYWETENIDNCLIIYSLIPVKFHLVNIKQDTSVTSEFIGGLL